jgi:hypothetical protein
VMAKFVFIFDLSFFSLKPNKRSEKELTKLQMLLSLFVSLAAHNT